MLSRKQKLAIISTVIAVLVITSFSAYTYQEYQTLPETLHLKDTVSVKNFNSFVRNKTGNLSTPDAFFSIGTSNDNAEYVVSFAPDLIWQPGVQSVGLYAGMVNHTANWPYSSIFLNLQQTNSVSVNNTTFQQVSVSAAPMVSHSDNGSADILAFRFPINIGRIFYIPYSQHVPNASFPPHYDFTFSFSLNFSSVVGAGPYHFSGTSIWLTGSYEFHVNSTGQYPTGNVTKI